MDDLRRRFASLDQVPAPDLWTAIEQRAAGAGSVGRVTAVVTPVPVRPRGSNRRSLVLLLATAAVLVALVAGAIAIGSRRAVPPAVAESYFARLSDKSHATLVRVPGYRHGCCWTENWRELLARYVYPARP